MSDDHDPVRGEAFAAQAGDDRQDEALLAALWQAYAPFVEAQESEEPDDTRPVVGPADDVAVAQSVAVRLFEERTALAFFPEDVRDVLGPVEEWRWCLPYVRCCWMFGWLICRGCRDFRAINYYLYRYWLCVRQAVNDGRPRDLTPQDRQDFETLSAIMAEQYSAWLKDEQAKTDLERGGLVDDVLDGTPDCCRDNVFTATLFERLASPKAAAALMGRDAFARHGKHPYFWLCRCWCQAAIRFGCCLACARTRRDFIRCIREYRAALAGCLGPLHCRLLGPTGCWQEEPIPAIHSLGVTVSGTVAGAWFGGYTIEWRLAENRECTDNTDWTSADVFYPGGGTVGGSPVVNGTLGWIKTRFLPARTYEVRVCPRSTRPGERVDCCCTEYNLFKRFVMIEAVGIAQVGPGGIYDPDAPLVYPVPPSPTPHLVPVGCCVHVYGAAWVGECEGRRIHCVTLRYAPGCLPGPMETGFDPSVYTSLVKPPLCYEPPDETEKRDQPNQLTAHHSVLTTSLVQRTRDISAILNEPPGTTIEQYWTLEPRCWDTTTLPACLDDAHHCASGQYTLLLDVEDQLGNHYYDTQCVWFDNKPLHLALAGLDGVRGCDQISLRRLTDNRSCATPWPRAVLGIAFDEWIIHNVPTYPSNNFDFYSLTIHKNCGGPVYRVPITPDLVRWHKDIVTGTEDPFKGTERVGEPGTRCPCDPPPMQPRTNGILTLLDLRAFDAVCAGQLQFPFAPPAGFPLRRGECCAFTFVLEAQDKTVDNVAPGNCHHRRVVCSFTVCNDLPRDPAAGTIDDEVADTRRTTAAAALAEAAADEARG